MIEKQTLEYFDYDLLQSYITSKAPNLDNDFWDIWMDCVYEDVGSGKVIKVWFMIIIDRLKEDFLKERYGGDCEKILPVIEELSAELDPNQRGVWVRYTW